MEMEGQTGQPLAQVGTSILVNLSKTGCGHPGVMRDMSLIRDLKEEILVHFKIGNLRVQARLSRSSGIRRDRFPDRNIV